MASLIHEGTGTGQGWDGESVSALAMRSESCSFEELSAPNGVSLRTRVTSQAHDLLQLRWSRRSIAIDCPYESAIGSTFLFLSS